VLRERSLQVASVLQNCEVPASVWAPVPVMVCPGEQIWGLLSRTYVRYTAGVGGALTSAIPDAGDKATRMKAIRMETLLSRPAAVGRPVVLAGQRLLAVPDALTWLFPDGGLRRGSTVSLAAGAGRGTTSLALALTGPVTRSGCWVAAVGLSSLGLVAAAQLGASLDRVALVPSAGEQWPVVAAALLDSVDVLLLAPSGRVRPADARRLTARVRERGAVLVILPPTGMQAAGMPSAGMQSAGMQSATAGWPEAADVHLSVVAAHWEGLEAGAGHLRSRVLDVVASGRRAAARPRRGRVWLPGHDGRISMVRLDQGFVGPGVVDQGGVDQGAVGPGGVGPVSATPGDVRPVKAG
jgi:hypothetical protein